MSGQVGYGRRRGVELQKIIDSPHQSCNKAAIDKADKFFASGVLANSNATIGTDRRYIVTFTYEDLCSAYGLRQCQLPAPSDWGMGDVVSLLIF